MLMAAGLGTRLRPFTDICPKAMLPLLGVPMAQFAVDALVESGVSRIVINVHHHGDRMIEEIDRLDAPGQRLIVSDERGQLLGSSGGIRKALDQLGPGPFFLMNADVLSSVDLRALALHHRRMRARWGALLTLAVLPGDPNGTYREIFFDPSDSRISRLGELATGRPYFCGVAVIEPEAVRHLPEGPSEFVPSVLEPAVRAGRACVFPTQGLWRDVGSPALWLDTHLSLLRALETGNLPRRIRSRIESTNLRLAHGIWVSRRASRRPELSQWAGACYWAPETAEQRPPRALGPGAVAYGETAIKSGISFGGEVYECLSKKWVSGTALPFEDGTSEKPSR